MNGQQLYDNLKDALSVFGLRFSEMEQITVEFEDGKIIFSHDGMSVVFATEK